jgi:hypothetical protein
MYYDNIKMWLVLGILSLIVYFLGWCHGYNTGKEVGITVGRARAWKQSQEHFRNAYAQYIKLPSSEEGYKNLMKFTQGEESNV